MVDLIVILARILSDFGGFVKPPSPTPRTLYKEHKYNTR